MLTCLLHTTLKIKSPAMGFCLPDNISISVIESHLRKGAGA